MTHSRLIENRWDKELLEKHLTRLQESVSGMDEEF